MTMEFADDRMETLAGGGCPIPADYVSTPHPISFATADGQIGYALYYPPTNSTAHGPAGQRPPLLVQPHAGPTTAAKARLELRVQFFTSRGFAVADVNYAGSTGYGRAYRERLTGRWGVADAADCIQAAHHLIAVGEVDPTRIVIAGASAGGFTALCALATHDLLAGGTSYFGIADLETFRRLAPKFQAHQLDRLIGPYPQSSDLYRARSPLHLADRIRRPVLLLQGIDDPIVAPAQAETMVKALERNHVPYRYRTFPGEAHGFHRADTIRQALDAELAFYQHTLNLP